MKRSSLWKLLKRAGESNGKDHDLFFEALFWSFHVCSLQVHKACWYCQDGYCLSKKRDGGVANTKLHETLTQKRMSIGGWASTRSLARVQYGAYRHWGRRSFMWLTSCSLCFTHGFHGFAGSGGAHITIWGKRMLCGFWEGLFSLCTLSISLKAFSSGYSTNFRNVPNCSLKFLYQKISIRCFRADFVEIFNFLGCKSWGSQVCIHWPQSWGNRGVGFWMSFGWLGGLD